MKKYYLLATLLCLGYTTSSWSAYCGTNCEYSIEDGVLLVWGTGPNGSGRLDKGVAFLGNHSFQNVIIEDGISYIGDNAFTATRVNNFEIKSETIEVNPYAFDYNTMPNNMISKNVILMCGKNCTLYIDEKGHGVATGSGEMQYGVPAPWRSKLTSLEISEGISKINGFGSCENLEELNIKGENVEIVANAFKKGSIKSLTTSNRKTKEQLHKYFGEDVKYHYTPKLIYTVEEAMKATENGDKFHVMLTYK